jgi:hypothetical protein
MIVPRLAALLSLVLVVSARAADWSLPVTTPAAAGFSATFTNGCYSALEK